VSTKTNATIASLESLREYIGKIPQISGHEADVWSADINRAIRALMRDLHKPRRRYRYCTHWGEIKALVAATPAGGTITVQDVNHANCVRVVARSLSRHVKASQITKGQPERLVTLLD
jgi:hypothetical protein